MHKGVTVVLRVDEIFKLYFPVTLLLDSALGPRRAARRAAQVVHCASRRAWAAHLATHAIAFLILRIEAPTKALAARIHVLLLAIAS